MKGRPKVTKELRAQSVAIAKRLKEARQKRGVAQAAAASRCGIKRVSYAAYEEGRNIVPAGVGMLFCLAFDVSFRWLATGKGAMFGCEHLATGDVMAVPEEAAYSIAFDDFIRPGLASAAEGSGGEKPHPRQQASQQLDMLCGKWKQVIPENDWSDYIELLAFVEHQFRQNKLEFLRRLSREFRGELASFPGAFAKALEKIPRM